MISCLDAIAVLAAHPVSAASAAAFRIAFGLLGFAAVVRFAAQGWISELFLEPSHHFTYYGFSWGPALAGLGNVCAFRSARDS